MFRVRFRCCVPILFGLVVVGGSDARAGGFYVREQSTSALGSAMAGSAAQGPDASHMYYNPATILDAGVSQLTIDVRGFAPDAEISAQSATSPLLGVGDITGLGGSGSLADPALAPALYATQLITKDLAFGIGVSAPFNVVIDTNAVWAGEFQLIKTDMRTVNINPVVAYRVAPWMDVAVGFQIQRFEADLRKIESFFGVVSALGYVKGHGYGYGYNAGILLKPNEAISIGLSYRSRVTHELRGSAGAAGFPTDGATFDVTTPEIATLGLKARVTPQLSFLAQAEWAGWSRFDGFIFRFDSGRPDEHRPQDWRNTWFGAVGLSYELSDVTEVSAGVSYDQSASKGANNTLSPDGDRTLVSAGISHQLAGGPVLRASYAHMFIKDAPIDVTNSSGSFVGTLKSDLDILGLSATWSW